MGCHSQQPEQTSGGREGGRAKRPGGTPPPAAGHHHAHGAVGSVRVGVGPRGAASCGGVVVVPPTKGGEEVLRRCGGAGGKKKHQGLPVPGQSHHTRTTRPRGQTPGKGAVERAAGRGWSGRTSLCVWGGRERKGSVSFGLVVSPSSTNPNGPPRHKVQPVLQPPPSQNNGGGAVWAGGECRGTGGPPPQQKALEG